MSGKRKKRGVFTLDDEEELEEFDDETDEDLDGPPDSPISVEKIEDDNFNFVSLKDRARKKKNKKMKIYAGISLAICWCSITCCTLLIGVLVVVLLTAHGAILVNCAVGNENHDEKIPIENILKLEFTNVGYIQVFPNSTESYIYVHAYGSKDTLPNYRVFRDEKSNFLSIEQRDFDSSFNIYTGVLCEVVSIELHVQPSHILSLTANTIAVGKVNIFDSSFKVLDLNIKDGKNGETIVHDIHAEVLIHRGSANSDFQNLHIQKQLYITSEGKTSVRNVMSQGSVNYISNGANSFEIYNSISENTTIQGSHGHQILGNIRTKNLFVREMSSGSITMENISVSDHLDVQIEGAAVHFKGVGLEKGTEVSVVVKSNKVTLERFGNIPRIVANDGLDMFYISDQQVNFTSLFKD